MLLKMYEDVATTIDNEERRWKTRVSSRENTSTSTVGFDLKVGEKVHEGIHYVFVNTFVIQSEVTN